jgi:hypothetical protein
VCCNEMVDAGLASCTFTLPHHLHATAFTGAGASSACVSDTSRVSGMDVAP